MREIIKVDLHSILVRLKGCKPNLLYEQIENLHSILVRLKDNLPARMLGFASTFTFHTG